MMRHLSALWLIIGFCVHGSPAASETIRVATYNVELSREGPGLALRAIQSGSDPQVAALVKVITSVRPDILALQGIDFDYRLDTLNAFADALNQAGQSYPHRFALPTNRGLQTGLDMDGDGRPGDPRDAQGFGRFYGQGAMAILSRFPIDEAEVQDFTAMLWRDLPEAHLPLTPNGVPFPSQQAMDLQRLSSSGHWVIPVQITPDVRLTVMTFHATPPVFDGPEDRNGLRNSDEILFWDHLLSGRLQPTPAKPFVLAGSATLDPLDSDGRQEAIRTLLAHPDLRDVEPESAGARASPDQGHMGDSALDTVDWPGVGRLRVDYVLPSKDAIVVDAGVYWPPQGTEGHEAALAASRHRLVWVDLNLPM